MKFIVDRMLGRLCVWLRILGFDTTSVNSFKGFSNCQEDTYILKLAEIENRVLLTRDAELHMRAKKRGLKSLIVMQGNVMSQLKLIRDIFEIKIDAEPSILRCTVCNEALQITTLEEVRRSNEMQKLTQLGVEVEEFLKRYNEYYKCSGCGKIYWQGSHWENILHCIGQLAGTSKENEWASSLI